MQVLLRIAVRNLKEHKAKTFIIGIIIALGIAVLVIGNSWIETVIVGLEKLFINSYSGHIMITGQSEGELSIYGYTTPHNINDDIPVIQDYTEVYQYVQSHPLVESVTSQISGRVLVSEEEKIITIVSLFGIEPESYQKMFKGNIEILEGRFLMPGEEGIVLSERIVKAMEEETGKEIKAGDSILLTSIPGPAGIKIRELPVRGIYRYINSTGVLRRVCFIDVENARALSGLIVGSKEELGLDDSVLGFTALDEESLFGEGDMFESLDEKKESEFSEESLMNLLGDKTEKQYLIQTDTGAWHFILVRLKSGLDLNRAMNDFKAHFEEEGIPVEVSDWLASAGMIGSMAYSIQVFFNIVVIVIAVVAVIIIMNTLVVSILERTREIGTMRALGAQKPFVRKLISVETLVISGIFGVIGIAFGILCLWVLNLLQIPAPNIFFEMLFGGKVLEPALSIGVVLQSLVIIVVIGLIASLYPVAVALKIEPVRAIQKG